MEDKYCSECKEKFQDGEAVAIDSSSKEAYHHIFRNLGQTPIDCSMKKAMQGVAIFERKVYYDGKFYGLGKLGKLSNSEALIVEFNEKNTGDIVRGDLKGLAKKFLGIF